MEGRVSPALEACRRGLRPIARWMLRAGVTWKEFADVSRGVFVSVATDEFGIKGRPTNVSRVALMTGLTRREVRGQRKRLAGADNAQPDPIHHATRVLTGWHRDAEFLDTNGRPRTLADEGPASFQTLLKRYAGDIPPGALAKELVRSGCVERLEDGTYRALSMTYIPQRLDAIATTRSGDVLADLATTVEFNLSRPEGSASRIERRAHNRRIDPKDVPIFRALLEREAQALLERMDDWLSARELPETHRGRRVRLGLGIYQITDTDSREARDE
jgi:uncharacterized protein DUF6502